MTEKEYNRMMVEKILKLAGFDFFANPPELNDPWCDDDNPTVVRSLPADCINFLFERTYDMKESPKSLYDLL